MNDTTKLTRTLVGEVTSKVDKTIVVKVTRQEKDPLYGKYLKRSSKIHAHDEKNQCHEGDKVMIQECRPISKTKSWSLAKIIEKRA